MSYAMIMNHTYIAYIDESGDDGLGKFREPNQHGGASKWFVISAIIARMKYDLEMVKWRDDILLPFSRKREILHFRRLKHEQRLHSVKIISTLPIRGISIITYKPQIPLGIYTEKNQLYFYMTRYLIERISWLCRDYRGRAPEGNGLVKIVFSRRGGMKYNDFIEYMRKLQRGYDCSIHWPVIDIDGISAMDHSRRAGLQIADCFSSSIFKGLELDKFGNCEYRYAEILKRIVYRGKNRKYFGYGFKVINKIENLYDHMTEDQKRTIDIFKSG